MTLLHRLNALKLLGLPAPSDRRAQVAAAALSDLRQWQAADVDRYSVHWCEWTDGTACRGSYELVEAVATSREAIIEGIADGQWGEVEAIRCGNEAFGTYRNVTPDIADDVLQHCIDEEKTIRACRDFLERHLGLNAVRDAIAEHPYLDEDYHEGVDQ